MDLTNARYEAIFRVSPEVIWRRTGAHGRAKKWGPIHDTLLFYTMSDKYTWNRVFENYDQSYLDKF